ncbi:hypothetical protein NS228_12175 [Methylobacterium indicum]|uniref:chorismate--pyruvate lyase family protein n=1 Tax=Methylobacterium indicum TaxID=1775910 RepID=UPI000792EB48|nr:chorismate lyase [Methylobacterium indicum]KTS37237.1 hypothetical protein NS229_07850 [Methylobacterium indicum]KTS40175.1 hypothetical protein NS228_12175 [Methylobacterium indicum]KTS54357.1 hypothetical protein NS230_01835 [Methylobacterium indicum]
MTTDACWSAVPPSGTSATQKDWLTRPGSLTKLLATLGELRLVVILEKPSPPWKEDLDFLNAAPEDRFWIREVLLLVDGEPCVFGHTVVRLDDSEGAWRSLRHLGDRPLAELLYQDTEVIRSALTSAEMESSHPMAERVCEVVSRGRALSNGRLLARRSIFQRSSRPLLVVECMLPELWRRADMRA